MVADDFAVYLKTKNLHWHLSGSHFRNCHLMFDAQADQPINSTNPLAERVRKLGGTTLRSISQISGTQTVQDNYDDFVSPQEMLKRRMQDNQTLARNQRAAHEVSDDNRDYATASLMEVMIDEKERHTWFLFKDLRGDNQA